MNDVDRDDGLVVIEAEREQLVMDMVLVGQERRAPFDESFGHHHERVEDRQPEDHQWQCRAQRGVGLLRQRDDEHPGRKAEKLAAAVSHEYPGRIRVEAKKADDAADHGDGREHDAEPVGRMREDRDRRQAEQRDAPGKPVQAIGEIDGVRDADEREDGQRNGNGGRQGLEPQEGEGPDDHATVKRHDERRDQLPGELEAVIDAADVVPDAEKDDDRHAAQKSDQHRRHRGPHEERQRGADRHREAAETRCRHAVHLAPRGHIGEMQPLREPHQRTDQHHGHERRGDESEE